MMKKHIINEENWRDSATCMQEHAHPDLFFPVDERGKDRSRFLVTDQPGNPGFYCTRCPVKDDCLEFALTTRMRRGVFGGMSPYQRSQLLNARRRGLHA